MLAILVITAVSLLFFVLYLGLVVVFALRTRKTAFRTPPAAPASRRRRQTLWVVDNDDRH
jgi:hypothetical protein